VRVLRGRNRRKLPVMVVSVSGYNLMHKYEKYDENTRLLMQLGTRPKIKELQRLGVSVLDWNPHKENFNIALLRQVRTR
jgi:hypothetical protein